MAEDQFNEGRPDLTDEYCGVVIFPPEPLVMPPDGTWRRLPDGRIEASLSLTQLRQMVAIKRLMKAKSEVEKEVV